MGVEGKAPVSWKERRLRQGYTKRRVALQMAGGGDGNELHAPGINAPEQWRGSRPWVGASSISPSRGSDRGWTDTAQVGAMSGPEEILWTCQIAK